MSRRKAVPPAAIRKMIEAAQNAGITPNRIEFTSDRSIIVSQEPTAPSTETALDRWMATREKDRHDARSA
jgi:hypothetical protein